jgi:hypothetical protein
LLGGTEIFTGAIQGRILVINAAAFGGLLALDRLAVFLGVAGNGTVALSMSDRHAETSSGLSRKSCNFSVR